MPVGALISKHPTPHTEPPNPMNALLMLILTPIVGQLEPVDHTRSIEVAAAEPDHFNWGSNTAVIFCCDFTQYPSMTNVEITHEGCDYSIFADQQPHLRLLAPEKSRFSMRFSLPEAPKAAFLEVSHLASEGKDGETVSPISITANAKPVVEDWNVGSQHSETRWSETRWAIGDKLQSGQNQIEWRAGKLRSHYWLRRVRVLVAYDHPVEVRFAVPKIDHALFWEGRFTQCSYNALATVLDHFYGVEGWTGEREEYEKQTFVAALRKHGLGAYYGWAPWTSYMAQAGTIRWNGLLVSNLKAERFALRPKEIPEHQEREMIVQYRPGEQAALVKDLLSRLEKGPVIIWTPYAAAMDRGRDAWRHVRAVDEDKVAVRFSPNMTHSVVINLEDEKVKVYDNSWHGGVWEVEPEIVVATAAAMTGSVRVERGNGKTLLGDGFGGIENDEYNVVFWKSETE